MSEVDGQEALFPTALCNQRAPHPSHVYVNSGTQDSALCPGIAMSTWPGDLAVIPCADTAAHRSHEYVAGADRFWCSGVEEQRSGEDRREVDMVNHPPHYADGGPTHTECGQPIECIDVVETMNFNTGNAVKYIWRAGKKGGPEQHVEDLRKAAWYLNREIERIEAEHQQQG